ncbi:MAG: hypothetical protein ABSG53_24355 [Thermoguttaceae bacterium]|jgi:hypothetical protein
MAGTPSTAAQRPPIYDGWEIDEQLRHVRRVLGPVAIPRGESDKPVTEPTFRLDAGHDAPAPHMKQARGPRKKKEQVAAPSKRAPGDRTLAALAWMTLSLGTAGFACGLALMVWSMNTGRQDLWTIGTPIVFAGQIALVMGLILQLDRVWRDSRWAATKMEAVDEQLQDLKTATTLLSTTHGPSSAFYTHWAGGAGPEILLSDLKSQLDLLAVKLSKQ